MQVQGLQGGFGVLAGQQQPNNQQQQPRLAGGIAGGKYGMNINMNITSTKYQGGGVASGGAAGGGSASGGTGLSVGPAAKGGGSVDDKNGQWTSPYSQNNTSGTLI